MADSKITALTALTAADPANDMLPIVDVSDNLITATGTTKRISINNILACSPSATLASATITGDLTAARLIVTGGTIPTNGLWLPTTNTLEFAANSLAQYRIAPLGVFTWYDGAGGTRMTLNSTGLGVGGSPDTGLLTVGATTITSATTPSMRLVSNKATFVVTADGATNAAGTTINYSWANGGQGPLIFRNAAISNVLTLDSTGNVGIGVTPSYKLDVLGSANVSSFLRIGTNPASSGDIRLPNNSLIVGRNAANSANLVMMQLDSSNALKLNEGSITIDGSANTIVYVTATAPTIANSNMVFNLTSNTNLRISVRGTDGTLRTANLTLA